jgi:hypothetical protein
MEAAMSVSTWAPARQLTDDTADIDTQATIPPGAREIAAGRRGRGRVAARERFASARRPTLRLVPPLLDGADWPTESAPDRDIAGEAAVEATQSTKPALTGRDGRDATDARITAPAATSSIARPSVRTRAVIAQLPIGPMKSPAWRQSAHAPVRLTRRGRVVLAGVLLAVAAALVVVLASTVQAAPPSSPSRAVVVHPGDTLWSIAARVHPRGSLTDTMLAIERLNHMPDGIVYVGQQLLIPGP